MDPGWDDQLLSRVGRRKSVGGRTVEWMDDGSEVDKFVWQMEGGVRMREHIIN